MCGHRGDGDQAGVSPLSTEAQRQLVTLDTAPHHHVHFAFDGVQTVTSLSPPHCMADAGCTKGESSKEDLPCAGPASIDGDSLPSVSSMEAEPSEVPPTSFGGLEERPSELLSTVSGGWGEGPNEIPPTASGGWGEAPSEIVLAQSMTLMDDEGADPVISDGEDLQLEPVLCEKEEMGDTLGQGGKTEADGTSGHGQEVGGMSVKSPGSRSACLKKAG